MKKKQKQKQQQKSSNILDLDLKSVIRGHSRFFDKLIELIPARFYLPTDDTEKPSYQGLSIAEKDSLKQKSRDNIKKARQNRLDPEKSTASTLDLLKESLKNETSGNDEDDDSRDEVMIKPVLDMEGGDRSTTFEDLRQRLRKKLDEFRAGRGGSDKNMKIGKNDRNGKRDDQQKKRKRDAKFEETKNKAKEENLVRKDASEAAKELAFGIVKLDNEDGQMKKKKKMSKEKELERAKRLEEAKKDPERGEIVAKKHSWKAATSRAAGIKVHDDVKLLKVNMQKEKKRHEKNAGKWKDRVETRDKMREEKQQARAGNIAERIQQKKMRKIAKREKKLMRPGFEGRKEGYINEDNAKSA